MEGLTTSYAAASPGNPHRIPQVVARGVPTRSPLASSSAKAPGSTRVADAALSNSTVASSTDVFPAEVGPNNTTRPSSGSHWARTERNSVIVTPSRRTGTTALIRRHVRHMMMNAPNLHTAANACQVLHHMSSLRPLAKRAEKLMDRLAVDGADANPARGDVSRKTIL
jgi:hypothetical protein